MSQSTNDLLDRLFQEWYYLGGAVLLAERDSFAQARCPEQVIAESTAHCRESGRLTWVALDWLLRHVEQVDEQRLLQETRTRGDLAVLGVLCDAARLKRPHEKFERIISQRSRMVKLFMISLNVSAYLVSSGLGVTSILKTRESLAAIRTRRPLTLAPPMPEKL